MSRWSQYDTDDERLPDGMQRIGYDADTQTYTFRDTDGSIWESAPGNQYGQLHRVSSTLPRYGDDAHDATEPPHEASDDPPTSWRHDMMPLLNWFLLVGLFLLFIFWFISGTPKRVSPTTCPDHSSPYKIKSGDSCWAIAEEHGVTPESLLQHNQGLDCDKLPVGGTVCIPGV
ncbi:carbohydrate-binding module family 50 protein [Hypoxylon rubiginosum]|uniref:Carbohydrate-binding module family 50 protein n=1 Tax=Hypoxylon rubiginosum TaxID=110542 RepID=A0ACB9ZC90_9PEZI|nr:carbohydrate-binding module family 50 protein [Hypoxylon rubiginosum]